MSDEHAQLGLDGGETPLEQPAAADEPRRVRRLVELNRADLERAAEYARRLNRRGQGFADQGLDTQRHEISNRDSSAYDELGAQGEIAAGRKLGIDAPLDATAFRSRADIPPHWDVKTQLAHSKDMLAGYLRLRPRGLIPGRRHILVERDTRLDGDFVFIVHGFITTERALEVGRRLYAYSDNLHVHVRHLEPIEPLCELDVEGLQEVAERWRFDDDGNLEPA